MTGNTRTGSLREKVHKQGAGSGKEPARSSHGFISPAVLVLGLLVVFPFIYPFVLKALFGSNGAPSTENMKEANGGCCGGRGKPTVKPAVVLGDEEVNKKKDGGGCCGGPAALRRQCCDGQPITDADAKHAKNTGNHAETDACGNAKPSACCKGGKCGDPVDPASFVPSIKANKLKSDCKCADSCGDDCACCRGK